MDYHGWSLSKSHTATEIEGFGRHRHVVHFLCYTTFITAVDTSFQAPSHRFSASFEMQRNHDSSFCFTQAIYSHTFPLHTFELFCNFEFPGDEQEAARHLDQVSK